MRLDGIVQSEGNLSRWQTQVLSQTTVRLRNGLDWLDSLRGDNQIVFTTPFAGDFKFTDRTGDIYNLMVLMVLNTASEHTVNFRSGKPDIVKMRFIYNQRR